MENCENGLLKATPNKKWLPFFLDPEYDYSESTLICVFSNSHYQGVKKRKKTEQVNISHTVFFEKNNR